MSEEAHPGAVASPAPEHSSVAAAIGALRAQGAHRFDPVRFHLIEVMARRAAAHVGELRQVLDSRIEKRLSAYGLRHEQARSEAGATRDRLIEAFPAAAERLQRLHHDGDFRGLRQLGDRLQQEHPRGLLADLVQALDRPAPEHAGGRPGPAVLVTNGSAPELKSLRYFRGTWSRLAVDRQLHKSRAKLPENAGPLNSHRLVLRSLQWMNEVSPDYLDRFMSYVDALFWLDQVTLDSTPPPANTARGDTDKKRKAGRGKAG